MRKVRLKREQLIFSYGERYSCVVDENGIPDFWTTLFLTTHYRSSTSDTMRGIVSILVHFRIWEEINAFSFYEHVLNVVRKLEALPVSEFTEPVFLSNSKLQSLARHCKITTKAARTNKKNKKIRLIEQMQVAAPPLPVVGKKSQRYRLKVISKFLGFIIEISLRHFSHYAYYLDASEQMQTLILNQKPKGNDSNSSDSDPDTKAPPPEVFEEIMRIAHPDCLDNPFTRLVRRRNYLISKVLFDTGMRAGELLQIKVQDIDFAGEKISIQRMHDDPEDIWRAREPNAKTLGRAIPISSELTNLLRDYITGERRKMVGYLRNSESHGFLFVSNKTTRGQPLSIKGLCLLIRKLSRDDAIALFIEKYGIRNKKTASPHSYRHNKNNQISVLIDKINKLAREEGRFDDVISEKKEKDIRKYLMGHRRDASAEVYNLRHTKTEAEKLNVKLMEETSEALRDGLDTAKQHDEDALFRLNKDLLNALNQVNLTQ